MDKQSIIKKVKSSIGDRELKRKANCQNCNEETEFILKFKDGAAICLKCNQSQPITEESYISIYKELNKLGVY